MKKNLFYTLAALFCMAAAMVSCTSEDEIINPENPTLNSRTITVNLIPEGETRTMLDADAKLRWQTGDEVSYFTSENGTDWSTSQKAEINASTGSFAATIPNGATQIRVVYPAVDNGTAFAESLTDVNQKQTYGAPLPLPMRTTATEISDGAQSINAHYTVNGAVVKVTVTGVEAADIKAVCLGKYTCEVPDGEASDDGTFFVVVPIGSTVEYTPSVHATDNGSKKTYIRKEAKTSTFTSKAYELSVNVAEADKYSTMTGWFVDNGNGTGTLNGHAWVDLGLTTSDGKRLVFATCNIGAENPQDFGKYFWWGDVIGYELDASNNTTFTFNAKNTSIETMNKTINTLQSTGWIDVYNNLTPEHDAATVQWGEGWRMMRKDEVSKLETLTGSEFYVGTVYVKKYSGNGTYTGNSIFIPRAGDVEDTSLKNSNINMYLYWTATASTEYGNTTAWRYQSNHAANGNRWNGYPIRPVAVIE